MPSVSLSDGSRKPATCSRRPAPFPSDVRSSWSQRFPRARTHPGRRCRLGEPGSPPRRRRRRRSEPGQGDPPMDDVRLAPGYYRDSDSVLYVNSIGDVYLVQVPYKFEPMWEDVGPPLSEDTEPAKLDDEDYELFERTRK